MKLEILNNVFRCCGRPSQSSQVKILRFLYAAKHYTYSGNANRRDERLRDTTLDTLDSPHADLALRYLMQMSAASLRGVAMIDYGTLSYSNPKYGDSRHSKQKLQVFYMNSESSKKNIHCYKNRTCNNE